MNYEEKAKEWFDKMGFKFPGQNQGETALATALSFGMYLNYLEKEEPQEPKKIKWEMDYNTEFSEMDKTDALMHGIHQNIIKLGKLIESHVQQNKS